MLKYDTWLQGFLLGKTKAPSVDSSDKSVHSVERFLEGKDRVWEIGITYTGRLVVRSGQITSDGISVKWKEWVTRHDVEIPKANRDAP